MPIKNIVLTVGIKASSVKSDIAELKKVELKEVMQKYPNTLAMPPSNHKVNAVLNYLREHAGNLLFANAIDSIAEYNLLKVGLDPAKERISKVIVQLPVFSRLSYEKKYQQHSNRMYYSPEEAEAIATEYAAQIRNLIEEIRKDGTEVLFQNTAKKVIIAETTKEDTPAVAPYKQGDLIGTVQSVHLLFEPIGIDAVVTSDRGSWLFRTLIDIRWQNSPVEKVLPSIVVECDGERWARKISEFRNYLTLLDQEREAFYAQTEEIGYAFSMPRGRIRHYICRISKNTELEFLSPYPVRKLDHKISSTFSAKDEKLPLNNKIPSPTQRVFQYINECSQLNEWVYTLPDGSASTNFQFNVYYKRERRIANGIIRISNVSNLKIESVLPALITSTLSRSPVSQYKGDKNWVDVTESSGPGTYAIAMPGFWNLIVDCSQLFIDILTNE